MSLLIDLDRKHAPVGSVVPVLSDCALKAVVEKPDAILKDVRKSNQQRQIKPALRQLLRKIVEIDRPVFGRIGPYFDMPVTIDAKVGLSPAFDLVELAAFLDAPIARLAVPIHETRAVAHS